MITIKDIIKDKTQIDEKTLVELSDTLWNIGEVSQIKEKVSSELFTLHIGINMIGNWKCDGWWYVISEQAKLVPYIPTVLQSFGLHELKTAFEDVINIFPEYTVFSNDDCTYYDVISFLENIRFKVSDERLNSIALEKRKEMVKSVRQRLDILEELTEPLWGYNAEGDGWQQVLDYIKNNI